jgi:hypothetical protein
LNRLLHRLLRFANEAGHVPIAHVGLHKRPPPCRFMLDRRRGFFECNFCQLSQGELLAARFTDR